MPRAKIIDMTAFKKGRRRGGLSEVTPTNNKQNYVVKVDRLAQLSYPTWFKGLVHPELERSGPKEFNLKDGTTTLASCGVNRIMHQPAEVLKSFFTLLDGLAIQKKGHRVFLKVFKGKALVLWGSVAYDAQGNLFVPYLYVNENQVLLEWFSLGRKLSQ